MHYLFHTRLIESESVLRQHLLDATATIQSLERREADHADHIKELSSSMRALSGAWANEQMITAANEGCVWLDLNILGAQQCLMSCYVALEVEGFAFPCS